MEVTENQATHSKIIKKKGTNFTSYEDARVCRAVQRKLEQKQQRTKSLANRRFISTPQCQKNGNNVISTPLASSNLKLSSKSLTSTTKKYSKMELQSLGKIRYENMLLWKKEKKKLIEKEKKKRKPAFVAGVYKPDAPKYLAGSEENNDVLSTTLLKSTSKSIVKNSLKTPTYQSVNSIVKAKVYKPLQFHSGFTPIITSSDRIVGYQSLQSGKETKTRCRISRAFRPPPNDLGISPLPVTPASYQENSKGMQTKIESFAPKMFNFKAPPGVKFHNLEDQKPEKMDSLEQMKNKLDILLKTDFSSLKDHTINSSKNISCNAETVLLNGNEAKHADSNHEEIRDIPISTNINEPLLKTNFLVQNDDGNSNCMEENSLKLSDSDTEDHVLVPLVESKLIEHAGRTPARRKTKSSFAKLTANELMNECTTPTTRLRPRTSCSRSTRRSQSAHCDHFCLESLLTPNSTKKRRQSRRSLVKFSKNIIELNQTEQTVKNTHNKEVITPIIESKLDETPAVNLEVEEINSNLILNSSKLLGLESNSLISDVKNGSPFKTPISHLLKKTPRSHARISNLLDTSPWINKSRGSASSQGIERRSVFSNDLECMFNNLPLDFNESIHSESLLPASPDLAQPANLNVLHCQEEPNCSFKENMTPKSELNELLKPSTNLFTNFGTPALIWGPDSPSPTNSPCTNEQQQQSAEIKDNKTSEAVLDKFDRNVLVEISSTINLKKTRRSSRKISVTFVNGELENERAGSKYPATPRKQSLRDFGSILSPLGDCVPVITESEGDLLHWDSPIIYKSGSRRKSQGKSLRISMLPGLKALNEGEDESLNYLSSAEPTEDLISFETPTYQDIKNKKRISKLDSATTPVRRSRRTSHIAPD